MLRINALVHLYLLMGYIRVFDHLWSIHFQQRDIQVPPSPNFSCFVAEDLLVLLERLDPAFQANCGMFSPDFLLTMAPVSFFCQQCPIEVRKMDAKKWGKMHDLTKFLFYLLSRTVNWQTNFRLYRWRLFCNDHSVLIPSCMTNQPIPPLAHNPPQNKGLIAGLSLIKGNQWLIS